MFKEITILIQQLVDKTQETQFFHDWNSCNVSYLKKEIESLKESYDKKVESIKEQIKERERRLEKIS